MFNFGAFAGGLATAIQTQQKLNLEEDKYNAEVKNAQDKLKLEGDKLKKQQEEDIAKAEKDKADGAVKVEEVMGKTDIGLEARINQANNMSKIYKLGTAKTMISDPTSGEKFVVDIPQEHLPTVEGIQKDLDIYKNEGNFKLDNTGALYTRPNVESEFTPIGFKGTNAKAFTKEDKITSTEMYNLTSPDGKVFKNTPLTAQETIDYRNKGYGFEKVYKPDRIINMGDKNPTAYTTIGISTLPEVQQQVLVKKGYSLNDKITNSTLAKILEQDNKPDSLTQQEAKVKNMMQTPEFKETYGNLSESEQKIKAQDKIWNDELERDPSKFKDYGEQISLDFQIKNDLATTKDVESSYDKLSPIEKKGLLKGQKESPEGKDYASNHAGKAKAVLDMERRADVIMKMNKDVLTKGFIVNTWDDAVNSIPDTWVNLSEKEKRTYLNKISTNGAVNDLFFVYLNAVNKGAPSNADMEVMKTIVQGLQSGNIETTQQAVKNFMSQVSNDTKSYYDNNAKSLYAVAKQEYENVSKFKYTAPIKVYGVDKEDKTLPPVNDYEKIAKEQGKVYDPANYEYSLVNGVLKQRLIKKGN